MSTAEETPAYTKKDFMSDQTIRWCPGCGDYAILSQIQTVFSELGIPKEQFAVISGIGCSSRFPYYMNTYGFHTIHGRAPAIATGLKVSRPELSVWVATGDGDGLSIGGNHLAHVLRRNVNLNILMFNNRIYGLTKGQYSPTSEEGKKTKSTPMGSVDHPFNPCAFALGCGATFVGRTADIFVQDLRALTKEAEAHRGTSFLELYQNCNIFNDGAFADVTDRKTRGDRVVLCKHGEPLLFGDPKGVQKGLRLNGLKLEIIELGDQYTVEDVLVHDETSLVLATLLAHLGDSGPVPMGVLYRVDKSTYDDGVQAQLTAARARKGAGDLSRALAGGNTWEVK